MPRGRAKNTLTNIVYRLANFLSRIWTRKEAFSKVCKKGLAMDFSKIDTLDEGRFRTFSIYNNYCISVSVEYKIDDESLEVFDVTADLEAHNE